MGNTFRPNVTCHQSSVAGTIPSIVEMNEDGFIALMKLYRSRQLDNPTMQTVAMRLSDADIEVVDKFNSKTGEGEALRNATYQESESWYAAISADMFSWCATGPVIDCQREFGSPHRY